MNFTIITRITRQSFGDGEFDHTSYVQDDGSRHESISDGRRVAIVRRCDLLARFGCA